MDRTAAFALGLVTLMAALIVINGLVTLADETHPDNGWTTALRELVQGPAQ